MTSALKIYSEEAAKLGLRVHWTKTKLMHIGDGSDPTSVDIDGTEVEFVISYTCLDSTLKKHG